LRSVGIPNLGRDEKKQAAPGIFYGISTAALETIQIYEKRWVRLSGVAFPQDLYNRCFYNRRCVLVSDFDYELPDDLIAQEPLPDRAGSRLLHLCAANGAFVDRQFRDFPAKVLSLSQSARGIQQRASFFADASKSC
jgi:hypothetical protein